MTKKIFKFFPFTIILVAFMATFSVSTAQDDMMDEGYEEAPMEYTEELPPVETFEDAPSYDEVSEPVYDDAGPGTPTEAIKDFNSSQDERMEQLDSYEEDY